jgi:hypothetical protein
MSAVTAKMHKSKTTAVRHPDAEYRRGERDH